MTKKTTPFIFRVLLETRDLRFLRGSAKRTSVRHLSSRRVVEAGRPGHFGPVGHPRRSFIHLVAPVAARKMEHAECRTLAYTPEQLYSLVADVDQYQHFVPWCTKSRVTKRQSGDFRAELEIGFPPVVERYTSEVTTVPNHKVRAVCTNGPLFRQLETVWRFSAGAGDPRPSCKVRFYVSFEFRSLLHRHLTGLFLDEVVKQMIGAFESRAAVLYGHRQGALSTG